MASISFDSELMTNYVEAMSVPAGSRMVLCRDTTTVVSQPVVFALSNEDVPLLQLIRINTNGRRVLENIADRVGVAADAIIQTFDAKQATDGSLRLVFAVKVNDRESELWIIKKFSLGENLTLQALPRQTIGRVDSIRVGPIAGTEEGEDEVYPMVYITHQPLNRTANGSDLSRIEVSLVSQSWRAWKDLTLPENVQSIIDIAPASAGMLGQGLVYLTEQNGKRSITASFIRPGDSPKDLGIWTTCRISCPPGASSIETFTDPRTGADRSSMLVGCTAGIVLLSPKDIASTRQTDGKLLCGDECLAGLTDLYLAQDGECLSAWGINGKQELVFVTTELRDGATVRCAPLLPGGSATSFAAAILQKDKTSSSRQSLVVNDKHGNLTLLQQDLSTGVWRKEPFYVERGGKLKPIQSYTITIIGMEQGNRPLCLGDAFIKAASTLPVTENGKLGTLSSEGSWCKFDCAGELALIIATDKVSSQPIRVEKLRAGDGRELAFSAVRIDPADKIIAKMQGLVSEDALANAKTKDGKSLWDGTEKPSSSDLKSAAACFQAIAEARKVLPSDGSVSKPRSAASVAPKNIGDSIVDVFMDGFHWIKEKAIEVVNWIVHKADEFWHFVCTIGEKTMTFVLDCLEKVTEAASWVWGKLKVGWEKFVQYVGFLFSWDDILVTKNTIKGLLNAGLDYAADTVESFNPKIDSMFGNIQTMVASITGVAENPKWKSKISPATEKKDQNIQDMQNSTSNKWIGERMKNGGASQTASKPDVSGNSDAELVNLWQDRVQPLITSFTDLAEQLGNDISELFHNDSKMSQEQLLTKLGADLLENFLEIIKNLLKTIVSMVAKLVLVVKDFGNLHLSTGFLNSLYRMISGGSDLSLFDAISLIIAIPSTFIIKLVTGAAPPTFPSVDKQLIQSFLASKDDDVSTSSAVAPASKQTIKDMTIIVLGCGCGAAMIKGVIDNIKFLYKTATGGVSVVVEGLSPSAIMEVFSMCIDAFSIFKDVTAPPKPGQPGEELRAVATGLKAFRLVANAAYMIASKLGLDDPVADQIMLCVDLLTAFANFGIYAAVYVEELEATEWVDYDEGRTITDGINIFLETLSAFGYFTAFTFTDKEPVTTLVGLVCMQVAALGAIVTKGVEFRLQYDKL